MAEQDNLDPAVDNQDPVATPAPAAPVTSAPAAAAPAFSWKTKLGPDLANSATLSKFDDTPEGLSKAVESHLNLEKLLGHEKVPIPKDANDKEGWARFNKALGVPDKPEGYTLKDVVVPDGIKDLSFDKKTFAEAIHREGLTPKQAAGLWETYTKMNLEAYQKLLGEHQTKITEVVNQLRSEWGDAYDSKVALGQLVINKFAAKKEDNDFLTATLTKDPRGIKFLAEIGRNFAENKVGEFNYTRFSLTPEEAKTEWDKIVADPSHPYNNEKSPFAEREAAIKYVNQLIELANKAKPGQA